MKEAARMLARLRLTHRCATVGTLVFATLLAWGAFCLVAPHRVVAQEIRTRPDGYRGVPARAEQEPAAGRPPLRGWENWNPDVRQGNPLEPTVRERLAPPTQTIPMGPAEQEFGNPSQLLGGTQQAVRPQRRFLEASRIVARVGDQTIFAGDLLPEINELIETRMGEAPDAIKDQQREKLLEQLIPRAVEQKLMFIDATQQLPEDADLDKMLASVRDSFVEAELPRLLEQYNLKTATELDALFRAYGGSVRRRRQQWAETQFISYMLRQQIDVDPEITHQELIDYYQEHLKDYEIPAKAKWQELMVRFSKIPNRGEARQTIARMGDEVVFGAPFEAVAKRRSHGFTADEGGYRDWTSRGALKAQQLDEALFELPINYLSDIIESDQGLHIIRVLERQDRSYVSFREAQIEIREKLKKQKRSEALEDYMRQVRDSIPVWTILDEREQSLSSR